MYQVQTLPASKRVTDLKDFAWFCEFLCFHDCFFSRFFINIETCTGNFHDCFLKRREIAAGYMSAFQYEIYIFLRN